MHLLITDPRTDRHATPAQAVDQAVHGIALTTRAVLHGDGAGAGAVEGAADGVVAGAEARTLHVGAILVASGGVLLGVAGGAGFAQSRGQVGRLVLGRVGPETRGRRDVDWRGCCLCHVSQVGVVWQAVWEQRKAAVARVLEQKVGLELQVAGGELVVVVGVPRGVEQVVLPEAPKDWFGLGWLDGSGDGSALSGGFAAAVAGEGGVAERWWRRGLQLHGGRGGRMSGWCGASASG